MTAPSDRSAANDPGSLRVLVATVVHTPLDARIHHRQIRSLVMAGHRVIYAAPWSQTGTPPEAAIEGVRTVDLPRAQGRQRLHALAAARRLLRRAGSRTDLILLHDPELVLAVATGRPGTTVVLDVHEDLPASLTDRTWIPGWARPIAMHGATALERWAATHLDGLLLAEHRYADRLGPGHPVVPNLPWLPPEPPPAGTHARLVYVGRLSRGRGVVELLELGRRLRTDPRTAHLRLHLVGEPDRDVRDAVIDADRRADVVWHGFLPNEEALRLVAGSLAGLAPLHDLPNYRGSMPTKVLEYLAHAVPAIVTPLPEARRVIEASGAGVVLEGPGVEGMQAAIATLATTPDRTAALGRRGREYVREHHSWDAVGPRFADGLAALARR